MKNSIITRKETASASAVTLFFNDSANILPGQFLMVWVPGTGEIPISLSHLEKEKGITVKAYGETSSAICSMNSGDRIYYRGPYGRPFTTRVEKRLIIGGGTGMAGLLPLVDRDATIVASARTVDEILFRSRFRGHRTIEITDDGSSGFKGYPVDALETLNLDDFDVAYVCGPELMMYSVYRYIKDFRIEAQFSMERIMKCGVGICDSCSIGGYQLCRDGPTFLKSEIPGLTEFGVSRTTESGRRIWFRN
ncbi:MAG: dihydroorotate dehydrogenase electron transfer subunit [Candidatus Thermoplasmatota archaeon]|nr:dihydroorotate dehydrogenase electron transfer subunit [Candidatus Thermoplasmatota archaeon]